MRILFVHPNYPGHFRYVAPRLVDQGWECAFVTRNGDAPDLPGVRRILYDPAGGVARGSLPCTHRFQAAAGHAQGVYKALKASGRRWSATEGRPRSSKWRVMIERPANAPFVIDRTMVDPRAFTRLLEAYHHVA